MTTPSTDTADAVRRQYERWSYPPPVEALTDGQVLLGDPSVFGAAYWPRRADYRTLSVLVAGCGTVQAASCAQHNPTCRVLGIDISEASLAHSRRLKEAHGLGNLDLRQVSLLDAAALGERFDLILCTGVLHHLSDPNAGLAALASVLADDGVMHLMLYGRSGRQPIYPVQEAFRLMGLGTGDADVDVARAALAAMPPTHGLRHAFPQAEAYDPAELVDLFLHPCDRAYGVAEVLDLVARAGLAFMGWDQPFEYAPEGHLAPGHPLRTRLEALPEPVRWHVIDVLLSSVRTHVFNVCRAERPAEDYRLPWTREAFLDYVPVRHPGLVSRPIEAPGEDLRFELVRGRQVIALPKNPGLLVVLADGQRRVIDILRQASFFNGPPAHAVEMAFAVLSTLRAFGHVMMRLPPD